MPYTNEEAADMLLVLGECRVNYTAAARLYAERYPERVHHSRRVFQRLVTRLRTQGMVLPTHNRQAQIIRHVRRTNDVDILAAVSVNPHVSIRQLSRDSGLSRSTVGRILSRQGFHPYHINLHQQLEGDDFQKRVFFSNWLKNKPHSFCHRILWTDEATFKSSGEVNIHNAHYWSPVNQHWLRELDQQHIWSVNTWCGLIGNQIIGPYFFDGSLNGETYADFLDNVLPYELLENVSLVTCRAMWFQHDGCPAHYARVARQILDRRFLGWWIGRGGPVAWPPRSPDLTLMDFYLWGRLKDVVYEDRPTTRDDMKRRIRIVCSSLSAEEILRATDSVQYRIQRCLAADGGHFIIVTCHIRPVVFSTILVILV